jgi:hypothetical protein
VARKAVGDLKDEWARKTMLEHCDEGSAVVLVAAVVVVSEDMVADEGPWASAFASLGVQALGAPHQGNYCFGYCSSCLDAEDAAAETYDNFHHYQVPSHPFEDLLVQQGHPRVQTRGLPGLTQHPAFLAFLDVLVVMASYPNAAFYRTWQDASAFFVAAVGPS